MTKAHLRLAVTMGDPVGIGPEVIAKAVVSRTDDVDLVIYGDLGAMRLAWQAAGVAIPLVGAAAPPSRTEAGTTRTITVVEVSRLGPVLPGSPTLGTDRAQLEYIERAVADVQAGHMDGLVTAPISKAAIARAGSPFPGHTEMLAALTAPPGEAPVRPVMMLAGPSLKVVPLTVHVPLAEVPGRISIELLLETLRVVDAAGRRDFGLGSPRIAVAGLNPHAGEGGMFSDEEPRILQPAINRAVAEGIDARGPFPADTVFQRAVGGEFDVVIGMYHDQALIPVKLLDFDRAVNVTLGLPIVRTSVDHGTAYDIAGRGLASGASMRAAIDLAVRMCRARRTATP